MNRNVITLLAAVLLLAGPGSAYAYLDPGSGSAILQGILGALAAIGVVAKLYWYRILRFLGLKKGPPPQAGTQGDDAGKPS